MEQNWSPHLGVIVHNVWIHLVSFWARILRQSPPLPDIMTLSIPRTFSNVASLSWNSLKCLGRVFSWLRSSSYLAAWIPNTCSLVHLFNSLKASPTYLKLHGHVAIYTTPNALHVIVCVILYSFVPVESEKDVTPSMLAHKYNTFSAWFASPFRSGHPKDCCSRRSYIVSFHKDIPQVFDPLVCHWWTICDIMLQSGIDSKYSPVFT